MLIENQDAFTKWLIDELTPICDADPEALSKYVLALLKKPDYNSDELKPFIIEQLEVFLSDNATFVEKIFDALASKCYITEGGKNSTESTPATVLKVANASKKEETSVKMTPGASSSSQKTETPQASSNRVQRKRISPPPSDNVKVEQTEKEKEREREKTVRENRDNRDIRSDRRRSRSPRDRGTREQRSSNRRGRNSSVDRDRSHRRRSRSHSAGGGGNGSRSPPNYRRTRRRCKDFEERGFCIKGEQCTFSHGRDPMVVDENQFLGGISGAQPNFSLPPPGYNPMNPPPPGVLIAAEYNPEAPALTVTNYSIPPPPMGIPPAGAWGAPPTTAAPPPTYVPQPPGFSQPPPIAPMGYRGGMRGVRGGRGGRGGGIGRGGYHGNNRDSCTLQVTKIPPELNNIAKLNEHFAEFGTVDNIQVRYNGEPDSALITYASRYDANKAHKSPNPVLNNRFIKVFWHNKPEMEEGKSETAPASPPKIVEKPKIATIKESKFISQDAQNHRLKVREMTEKLQGEKESLGRLVLIQEKQTALLEKLMANQKTLLAKARATEKEEEKKKVMTMVKQVFKKVKSAKEEVDSYLLQISEKSLLVDELMTQLEALKKSPAKSEGTSRKRKASGSVEDETPVKIASIVVVTGVKESDVTDLMAHMEKFGDILDMNVKEENGVCTAVFPYLKPEDAAKAMADGKMLNGQQLQMELSNEEMAEVPKSDANMTADQLLASIRSGAESDDEDILNDL